MTATLFHHAQSLLVDVARLAIWLVILTVLFVPLERLFALRKAMRTRGELGRDLLYYFLNSLVPAALLAVPLSIVATVARQVTPAGYLAAIAALPLWATLLLGLIVAEIGSYWGHRWSHEHPVLWRVHVVHHGAEHLDWMVNTRAHPLDMVFTRLCGLAPLYLLGLASPRATGAAAMLPVYITLIGTVWSFFIHANLRWRFGPLEWLVSTPAFHHWHHTNDGNRDRNYAALMPWVDRLFGTHHLPRHWPPSYGVDRPPPTTLRGQLLHPFKRYGGNG